MDKVFQEWWVSLTPVERRVIGPNTAKFVWDAAYHKGFEEGHKEGREAQQTVENLNANH
jgi:hypothetical protein